MHTAHKALYELCLLTFSFDELHSKWKTAGVSSMYIGMYSTGVYTSAPRALKVGNVHMYICVYMSRTLLEQTQYRIGISCLKKGY